MSRSWWLCVCAALVWVGSASGKQDPCNLPLEKGPCKALIRRYGFNGKACVEFTYGGCKGNKNRFDTKAACEKRCGADVCELPLRTGRCKAYLPRYGFNGKACVEFIYGGCDGNGNRFGSKAACKKQCGGDVCKLPLRTGKCKAYMPRYGFNGKACVEFIYGGCDGNGNRFGSKAACEKQCGGDVCELPLKTGKCKAYMPRYGFNGKACVEFIYGGCDGNGNRFGSKAACEKQCGADVCKLPLQTGHCKVGKPRYGFNGKACVQFTYGGCNGNGNRFGSKAACEKQCGVDVCKLPLQTGHCKVGKPRYGFNGKACVQFTYGGCNGNGNRFGSKAACEKQCGGAALTDHDGPVIDTIVCALPIKPGLCKSDIPRFAYNKTTRTCEKFSYSGCLGNDNNFVSLQACRTYCEHS